MRLRKWRDFTDVSITEIDGNKRIGQLAMEAFLMRNGYEIESSVSAQETIILSVAAGEARRDTLRLWLATNVRARRL